jgi:hypothetical protein
MVSIGSFSSDAPGSNSFCMQLFRAPFVPAEIVLSSSKSARIATVERGLHDGDSQGHDESVKQMAKTTFFPPH